MNNKIMKALCLVAILVMVANVFAVVASAGGASPLHKKYIPHSPSDPTSSAETRTSDFAGYTWNAKSGCAETGPNYWSDGKERLHLKTQEIDIIVKDVDLSSPHQPRYPSPSNVDIDANLSWAGGDPDGDFVAYGVYFEKGDGSPEKLVSYNLTETTYDHGKLDYGFRYCWNIVTRAEWGLETPGTLWNVHNIDTLEDFATIQAAIDDPGTEDGHTIIVDAGMYNENIIINKALRLIGEGRNSTNIHSWRGTVVNITSDEVTLSGFTISTGVIGIALCSSDSIITNNTIQNIKGIYFINCARDGGDGIGIKTSSSANTIVSDNLISGISGGGGADDSGYCPEGQGKGKGGDGYGIILSSSTDVTISGNTISNIEGGEGGSAGLSTGPRRPGSGGDGYGIAVSSSANITILRNTIASTGGNGGVCGGTYCVGSSRGGDGYGIYVSSISTNNKIFNNIISDVNGGLGFDNNVNEPSRIRPYICGKGHRGYDDSSLENAWDRGPRIGGNYWASYCKGNPSVGSQTYMINGSAGVKDHYPFEDPRGWIKSSVWLYKIEERDQKHAIAKLKEYEINRVYLSVNPDKLLVNTTYKKTISDFIDLAWNNNNIEVHAMILEDPHFALRPCHPDALEDVNKTLQYNVNNSKTPFLGIHIDVEPNTLENWTEGNWTTREQIMIQYVELLKKVNSTIYCSNQTIEFSPAIACWYNEKADDGFLPHGNTSLLALHVDTIVPMVYGGVGGSAGDIKRRVSDEINEAEISKLPVRVIIGIGADEFETYDELNSCIKQLNSEFYTKSCYGGTSIFDYDVLAAIQNRTDNRTLMWDIVADEGDGTIENAEKLCGMDNDHVVETYVHFTPSYDMLIDSIDVGIDRVVGSDPNVLVDIYFGSSTSEDPYTIPNARKIKSGWSPVWASGWQRIDLDVPIKLTENTHYAFRFVKNAPSSGIYGTHHMLLSADTSADEIRMCILTDIWYCKNWYGAIRLYSHPAAICGDLNHDGVITPADAAIALELAASGARNPVADVSGDGRVTALDALMILQVAAGRIEL